MMILRLLTFILVLNTVSLFAHTMKVAYLDIQLQNNHRYAIKWKVPIIKNRTINLNPQFPDGCKKINSIYSISDNNLILNYWTIKCNKSLMGKNITIDNIENGFTDVLVHFQEKDETSYIERLTPRNTTLKIKSKISIVETIRTYTFLGIKHILIGFDHLLFVLGLMFLITRAKELIKTITAFTIAHSITLGLTILGYVHLPASFIEALIALSIIILAVEIIYAYHGERGLSSLHPWLVAFMFGLIHGFGFATVLIELGLPESSMLLALLFFNIGIETGQLLFILILILCYFLIKKVITSNRILQGKLILVYLIGITASYWFIERIYLIFN